MRDLAAKILDELGQTPASSRELFRFVEHAKIRLEGHRVVCWTASGTKTSIEVAYSIPYCNLAFLLLGPGCSVSTDAMELLAAAGVVVGFTGDAATPLHAGVEPIAFACGQSEYRPTQYMQGWARWWFDAAKRTDKARELLLWRAELIERIWAGDRMRKTLADLGVAPADPAAFFATARAPEEGRASRNPFHRGSVSPQAAMDAQGYSQACFTGASPEQLLGQEGAHVKRLYKYWSEHTGLSFAGRNPQATDHVNALLTMGNYIAYGLAATALHGIGISFAFSALHGKTRRGGLVFDVADPIKDAVVAPIAFACVQAGKDKDACRRVIKRFLEDEKLLAQTMQKIEQMAEPA
jgi:CRISPR-associated protein Cas1